MKRIGITQRVFERLDRGELWDSLDQRLVTLVESNGLLPVPLSNAIDNVERFWSEMNLDGVILSGGNDLSGLPGATDTSDTRDRFETALIKLCCAYRRPIFGICRGMQLLNAYFGGTLLENDEHIAKRHRVSSLRSAPGNWPQRFSVNSFHRWTIAESGLAPALVPLARADDGTIEAAMHADLPFAAVMWHPEREITLSLHDGNLLRDVFKGGKF